MLKNKASRKNSAARVGKQTAWPLTPERDHREHTLLQTEASLAHGGPSHQHTLYWLHFLPYLRAPLPYWYLSSGELPPLQSCLRPALREANLRQARTQTSENRLLIQSVQECGVSPAYAALHQRKNALNFKSNNATSKSPAWL